MLRSRSVDTDPLVVLYAKEPGVDTDPLVVLHAKEPECGY